MMDNRIELADHALTLGEMGLALLCLVALAMLFGRAVIHAYELRQERARLDKIWLNVMLKTECDQDKQGWPGP